jgi:hypothetical protein
VRISAALALAITLLSGAARAGTADEDLLPITLPEPEGPWTWKSPEPHETAMVAAAEALIVVDVLQTLDLKRHSDLSERNALLGSHPSDAKLVLLGSAAALGTWGGWYLLPPRYRWIVPTVVGLAELFAVVSNQRAGLQIRF